MENLLLLAALLGVSTIGAPGAPAPVAPGTSPAHGATAALDADTVMLPAPRLHGAMSLEEAIAARRSIREFGPVAVTTAEIAQLLWAMQGVTSRAGLRAVPSAGALYPLEIYVLTERGLHHYEPASHRLIRRWSEDLRQQLSHAALGQASVSGAPVVFVIAAVPARTAVKYGAERAERYAAMEAGHAAQNALLEATALGLAAVPMGAFKDAEVRAVLGLGTGESPIYIIPVGRARK